MPDRPNNSPASRLHSNECLQLNDWASVVGFRADYHQLGRGKFETWFDMGVGDELRVADQYCNREMSAAGVPPDEYIAILLTRNRHAKGIFQGHELKPNEIAIMRPGFESTYRTPKDLRLTTTLVPETRLRSAFEELTGSDLDDALSRTQIVSLPDELVSLLTDLSDQVLASSGIASRDAGTDAAATRPFPLSEIDDHFLTALITGLTGPAATRSRPLARRNRVRYVTAARDFIEAHLDSPLGLEILSRKLRVSPRTLEYAFRDVLGVTPLQYIKTRRLNAARRRFLHAADPMPTVTEVALDYGFPHLSYFARDYRALFAEYPSETLRRGKGIPT